MSGQNRFLLPPSLGSKQSNSNDQTNQQQSTSQSCSVDADFDSYWDEEARNPLRNRIRIGRQYQATVPPLLKPGERDRRKLDDLETLRFCPNKSADLTNAELEHYFNVAKSINLFASLVETRCLLGKDVTIADLNHIKNKEGLSLASVIQPTPLISLKPTIASAFNGQSSTNNANISISSQQSPSNSSAGTKVASSSIPQKSTNHLNVNELSTASLSSSAASQRNNSKNNLTTSNDPPNQQQGNSSFLLNNLNVNPFIKALSHFISLHHPGYQEKGCKKNQIETSLSVDDSANTTSLGTLRPPTTSSTVALPKETKVSRSRASKHASISREALDLKNAEEQSSVAAPSQDWTREEIELFSKALEVCGKNFGAIKKEFLPSKSVRSIVEYYYIGTREYLDSKRKTQQSIVESSSTDGCSSPEKQQTYNGQGGGGDDGPTGGSGGSASGSGSTNSNSTSNGVGNSTTNSSTNNNRSTNNADDQRSKTKSASDIKVETMKSEESYKQHDMIIPSRLNAINEDRFDYRNSPTKAPEDSRMSVYTFEDCKDDVITNIISKQSIKSNKSSPGAEVKPLKAKPIMPNASVDTDPSLSNLGSLKFYMDGQLVLKLNACQDQMKGIEKYHWVQSEEMQNGNNSMKHMRLSKKRLNKLEQNSQYRHDESIMSTDQQNSNSGMSYQDEDSKNGSSGDEDSKESADSMSSLKQANPSNEAYPSKKPKIKLESMQQSPLDYQNQVANITNAQRTPTLNSNHDQQPWSSQGLAAAAALFISQNAAALAVQHQQQSMKNENYDDPSNFIRSQADLMLLNRYSASQIPSLPTNEFAEYERAMRSVRAVTNNASQQQANSNRPIRLSPSSMSSTSTLENIGGYSRSDSTGYPPINLQQPPRAHSTSSSTSTSSSSASTLPMAATIPSNYGLSVTPSLSPATSDSVQAYAAAAMNRSYGPAGSNPVDLSVDTDCDTDMSVDLTMTPKKKSPTKKARSLMKTSPSGSIRSASNTNSVTPRYNYHV